MIQIQHLFQIILPRTSAPLPLNNNKFKTSIKSLTMDDIGLSIYDLQLQVSNFLSTENSDISPLSFVVFYFCGLLASLNPCSLGLVPLTLTYLSNLDNNKSNEQEISITNPSNPSLKALFYALGLSVVFSTLGLSSAYLGQVYGTGFTQSFLGEFPSLILGFVFIIMGLNLLELVSFNFPSFPKLNNSIKSLELPDLVQAMLVGAGSALVATPCSSPIIASLLTFITFSANPVLGGAIMMSFSLGYVSIVVGAGVLSQIAAKSITKLEGFGWVNELFASALIGYGTYNILNVAVK
eukprot:gene5401-7485_t